MWYKCKKEKTETVRGISGDTVHLFSSPPICIWSSSVITQSLLKHHVSDSSFPHWSWQWWMENVLRVSLCNWCVSTHECVCWGCSLLRVITAWCLGGKQSANKSLGEGEKQRETEGATVEKVWSRVLTTFYWAIKKVSVSPDWHFAALYKMQTDWHACREKLDLQLNIHYHKLILHYIARVDCVSRSVQKYSQYFTWFLIIWFIANIILLDLKFKAEYQQCQIVYYYCGQKVVIV